MLDIK